MLIIPILCHQPQHFTRVCMTSGLEFGVEQRIIDRHLVPASIGRDEGNAFDLRFELIKQILCQAHGPVGIVSNRAIGNANF